jgi:hypothetical protein
VWQVSPALGNDATGLIGTLFDETSNSVREKALQDLMARTGSIMSPFLFQDTDSSDFANYSTPRSSLYYPIFEGIDNKRIVASINLELEWKTFLENAIDEGYENPVLAVVEDSHGRQFTYNVTGPEAVFWGEGDLHTVEEGKG